MGYGNYSYAAHEAMAKGRSSVAREELFRQKSCHPLMNPLGVRARESRDSDKHPSSLAVAFALDVTGSMGDIPELLARRELPKFMRVLLDCGVADPQILFMAVGDANSDSAPLQVGQFESSEKQMDQWLTWTFIEGGGGGSDNESYELGLYFLARHTSMDCFDKRKKRGYLFMTGDELPYPYVSKQHVKTIVGEDLDEDVAVEAVVAALQKTFVPFFLIPDPGRRARCERAWRDLLGDHVLCLEDAGDTCFVAAGALALEEGTVSDLDALAKVLATAGATKERVGPILRALTPLASTLDRDPAPLPKTVASPLPGGDAPSGLSRGRL